jgi:hypothetical protein
MAEDVVTVQAAGPVILQPDEMLRATSIACIKHNLQFLTPTQLDTFTLVFPDYENATSKRLGHIMGVLERTFAKDA